MSSFLIGLFIGLVVGACIGLIVYSLNLGSGEAYRQILKDEEKQKEIRQRTDPGEVTRACYCLSCNHKWREYALISAPPKYCPNCGAPLEDQEEEKEDAVAVG